MIPRGTAKVKTLSDDWTVIASDKSSGAHFEHIFAVMAGGKPVVLTAIDGEAAVLGAWGSKSRA